MTETRTIPLTQDQIAIVDAADYDFLMQWKWYYGPSGYAARGTRANGKYRNIFLHRVVAELAFTEIPTGLEVDHIDGNRLNNTRSNLRLATRQQNQQNGTKRKHNTSGYKGVTWATNKWMARIHLNGKSKFLGEFNTAEEAARAYDAAALELHGEFARTNF